MKVTSTIWSRWRAMSESVMRSKYVLTQNADVSNTPASVATFLPEAARRDPKVAALLALLWQDDAMPSLLERPNTALPPAALTALSVFIIGGAVSSGLQSVQRQQEAHSLKELATFIHTHTPHRPISEAEYISALVVGLSASLRHNLRELRQTDEVFPILHLSDAVGVCGALQFTELHEPLCELLVGAHQAIRADRDGPRVAPCETLRRQVQTLLAALPPCDTTVLWRMLRDPQMSPEFWPVLEKMRQPSAVPYLLDVIPALNDEGRTSVIAALQNIGDARAVPYLQHLAQGESGTVAKMAASAVAHILRHNRSDAVQLLRASNARDGVGRETLLRPTPAPSDDTPDELLRAAALRSQSADETRIAVSSGHEKG